AEEHEGVWGGGRAVDVEEQGIASPRLEPEGLHHEAVHREAGALEAEALGPAQRNLPLPLAIEIGEWPLAGAVRRADEGLGRSAPDPAPDTTREMDPAPRLTR